MKATANKHITAEQLSRYERDGFVVLPAVFNDGTTRDVTHMAQYESNEEEMAHVDEYVERSRRIDWNREPHVA